MLVPETESDPPPAELYAALPESAPVIVPLETKSRHADAPDVAKLDALLPSNSNIGEDVTAAVAGELFPDIPIVITITPINRRVIWDFIDKDYLRPGPLVKDT